MSQRYLSPSRVDQWKENEKKGNDARVWGRGKVIKRKQGEDGSVKHGRGRKKKMQSKNFGYGGHDETMRSSVQHIGHDLTFVYAHVLPEVIVTAKVLPASFDRTLVRCNVITQSQPEAHEKRRKQTDASRWCGSIAHAASDVRRGRNTCCIRRPRTCTSACFSAHHPAP